MNARHLHALYRRDSPRFSAIERKWENLLPKPKPNPLRVEQFIRKFVQTPTVMVGVSRAVDGELALAEAAQRLCAHICHYEIHIEARDMSALVVIG